MSSSSKGSSLEELVEPMMDPIKVGLAGIDKKIRNLEKKKTKLESLRDEAKKSTKALNEDQSVRSRVY